MPTNTATDELRKRLDNKFIFSALIALVTFYRTELYIIFTKGNNWEESLRKIQFWNTGYLFEILVVLAIYLSSGFLGTAIGWGLSQITKLSEAFFENRGLISFSEASDLKSRIATYLSTILAQKSTLAQFNSEISMRTDAFMHALGFKGNPETHFKFVKGTLPDAMFYVYDSLVEKESSKDYFTRINKNELIRFVPGFRLPDGSQLVYEFKSNHIQKIPLGSKSLFNKIYDSHRKTTEWHMIYFSSSNRGWSSEPPTSGVSYFMLHDDGGVVKISTFP